MANHCYNYVNGSGSKENLARLKSIVDALLDNKETSTTYVECYYKVYPMFFPQEVLEQEEFDDDKKPWNAVYEDYGSKWFQGEFEIDVEDGSLTISGDSAWSPMLPFFIKLAVEYKLTLEGYYEESGMDFAGKFTISPTGELEDTQMSYNQMQMMENPEGFWQNTMDSIEEGYFDSMEEIINHFEVDYWGELTQEDLNLLEKAYKDYLANQEHDEKTL